MTESFDRPSGANNATGLSIEGSRVLLAAAAASGTKAATAAGNADAGNAHLLALRPAKANLAIPTPAGTAVNDVMIAAVGFNNATAAITPPAGWTLIRRMSNNAATSNALAVYTKAAAAGDPFLHVWAISGGMFLVGGIQSFSGVDTANPIDAESGQSTPSGTAHDTPSITTSMANTMLVTAHTFASSRTWTPQPGLVEGFDQPNSVADSATGQSITGTYQAQVAAGASGAKRSTAAGNADVGNTHILALRPFIPNLPPTVSFTSPPNNAVFSAPANITLTAAASDQDGTIRRVEFIRVAPGPSTLLASVTTPPYSFVWSAVPQGTYGVIARAVDNRGAERLAGVNFEVKQQSALHFIHVDHLNTPRLVADAAGTVVWKWDQQEPFGDAVPDENPSGLGAFEMPLAFPGTYRDKEIGGKLYNWNRTVDPALGRYLQSDAIGLIGGSNTYLHLGANPLRKVDLMGYVGDTVEGDGGRGKGGIGIPDIRGKASRDAASQIQKLIEKWFCPPGCDDIQEQIEAKITELRVRYVQMTADVHNLYCTRPFGAFSWLGHQFRYNRIRQELKELVDKAKAMGCSYDPEADEWIRREPPVCPAR